MRQAGGPQGVSAKCGVSYGGIDPGFRYQGRVDRNETARGLIKWAVDHYAQGAWNEPCGSDPPLDLTLGNRVTVEHLSFGS